MSPKAFHHLLVWPILAAACLAATELGFASVWWVHIWIGLLAWIAQSDAERLMRLPQLISASSNYFAVSVEALRAMRWVVQPGGGATMLALLAISSLALAAIDYCWRTALRWSCRRLLVPPYANFNSGWPNDAIFDIARRWLPLLVVLWLTIAVVTQFVGSTLARWDAWLMPVDCLVPKPRWFFGALSLAFIVSIPTAIRVRVKSLSMIITPADRCCRCGYQAGELERCPECGRENGGFVVRLLDLIPVR